MFMDHVSDKDQSVSGDLTMGHKKILTRRWCLASAWELMGHRPVPSMLVRGFLRRPWRPCLCVQAGCGTVAPHMPLK